MYVSGGKKCSFFGNFGVLCFLETPVLRFALLPYYRRYQCDSIPICSINFQQLPVKLPATTGSKFNTRKKKCTYGIHYGISFKILHYRWTFGFSLRRRFHHGDITFLRKSSCRWTYLSLKKKMFANKNILNLKKCKNLFKIISLFFTWPAVTYLAICRKYSNLVRTYVEIISAPNYLVGILVGK